MELIPKLIELQEKHGGYLPKESLLQLANDMNMPVAKVIGTASFYSFFRFDEGEVVGQIERLYECRQADCLLTPPEPYVWTGYMNACNAEDLFLQRLEKSGLTGRSGSAFSTAKKWALTKKTESDVKHVICNADEGEPWTGKDRILIEKNPYAVIEGMGICGKVVGAKKGFIYLRGEYADLYEPLNQAIQEAPFENFSIEIRLGQGAYICGEETALIESMENNRGEPRLKPPYPGVMGYKGCPTVVNNVETFANVAYIAAVGSDTYSQKGKNGSLGTRLYTVCGQVENPGVYELDAGLSICEILEVAGGMKKGKTLLAVQLGGGSGAILPKDCMSMSLTEACCKEHGCNIGTASLRVISEDENLAGYVNELLKFFSMESCGTCVPCRNGLSTLQKMLERAEREGMYPEEIVQAQELVNYIADNARCAMGRTAVTPFLSLLENFPEVIKK